MDSNSGKHREKSCEKSTFQEENSHDDLDKMLDNVNLISRFKWKNLFG